MPSYKFQTSLSSGEILVGASPATIYTGSCWLTAVQVISDGSNDAKAIVKDGAKVLGEWTVVGANNYGGRNYNFPVKVNTSIIVTITGTDASVIVEYIPQ